MGRSVPTYRMEMENTIRRWGAYRRFLNSDNQRLFDRMMNRARSLASAGSYQCYYDPTKTIFLSIMLDQLGELREMKMEECKRIFEENMIE